MHDLEYHTPVGLKTRADELSAFGGEPEPWDEGEPEPGNLALALMRVLYT